VNRISIGSVSLALVSAAIIAGCGGGGGGATPSGGLPTTSPAPSPSAPAPSPSSSPSQSGFTFGGSSANGNFTQGTAPSAVSLAAYHNISVSIQFAAPASGSGTLNFSDALNNGDVSPNSLPADNSSAGFTPLIYISVVNSGSTISFGANVPQFQISDSAGFGGATTCSLDTYSIHGNNNTPSWSASGATGTISGNSVTIGPATLPQGTVDFQTGQQIVAIACH